MHRVTLSTTLFPLLLLAACGQPDEGAPEGPIANEPPGDAQAAALSGAEQRVFQLINQARATARVCGTTSYAAAPPLAQDDRLNRAALLHSQDMVAKSYFSHTGSDGSLPWDRVTRQGYTWSTVGENIAAGYSTPDAAVQGWLKSPGHCANLMSKTFTQTGIGLAQGGTYRYYWTQVFAKPR